jgi:predicted ATPase
MLVIYMKLSVENFGPMKKVKIETKSLTIIIGKNSLGKSFLAQLIYSALNLRATETHRRIPIWVRPRWVFPMALHWRFQPSEIKRVIKESSTESEAAEGILNFVTKQFCSDLSEWIKSALEQNFGTKTSELINFNFQKSELKITYDNKGSINFLIPKRDGISAHVDFDKQGLLKRLVSDDEIRRILKKKRISMMDCVSLQESFAAILFDFVISGNLRDEEDFSGGVFYVPAGRAGLLESYDTVVSALVSLSPIAPLRGISMPPLPGTASQFYNIIMEMRGRKGPLSVSADKIRDLLGGEIKLTRLREPKGKAMISYVFRSGKKKRSLDIIHAASMIKELTPLYLVIKELVTPGDFLIIEEPESHLHPGAQLRLLEIFAELANKGVKVIMTTHSDLMLRKTAQLTGQDKLKEKRKEVSLDVSDVAIYWLKEERQGSVSREIKIGKYASLEEIPTFDEVISELYEAQIKLESQS